MSTSYGRMTFYLRFDYCLVVLCAPWTFTALGNEHHSKCRAATLCLLPCHAKLFTLKYLCTFVVPSKENMPDSAANFTKLQKFKVKLIIKF